MKRHLFNLITISLTTSVLLASAQKAFGQGVETQTNIKETQPLVHKVESPKDDLSEWAHNQGIVHEEQTTKPKAQSSQPSLAAQSTEDSDTFQGLFFIFLFCGYILGGIGYRKYRAQRATTRCQQIEMLERIWRMRSHQ